MTTTSPTPAGTSSSVSRGWRVLLLGSLVAFFVGAATQLLVFVGFGLCMDESEATCEPGTWPTAFESALATVPTYLIWLAPSVVALVLGYRALKAGHRDGRPLVIVAGSLAVLITIACTAMWWL